MTCEKITCHDCKREILPDEEYMEYHLEGSKMHPVKCRPCHEKDNMLRHFQPVEVYSRITGYIRPISQWNPGKLEEWKARKPYSELSMSDRCDRCRKKKCSCK